jgi:hypothetical protein
MGGMGANLRPPGKSGLTFDHILSRLQGEIQKTWDTGAELRSLSSAMNEINDTLGGAMVSFFISVRYIAVVIFFIELPSAAFSSLQRYPHTHNTRPSFPITTYAVIYASERPIVF